MLQKTRLRKRSRSSRRSRKVQLCLQEGEINRFNRMKTIIIPKRSRKPLRHQFPKRHPRRTPTNLLKPFQWYRFDDVVQSSVPHRRSILQRNLCSHKNQSQFKDLFRRSTLRKNLYSHKNQSLLQ
uniref:(northern house mosquito) hypothetical protein n=1 Tax=Culex pipiens TaxID=7175 RepID=A0A8D8HJ08_CULPI